MSTLHPSQVTDRMQAGAEPEQSDSPVGAQSPWTRWDAIWDARWWVLLAAVITAVVAFGVSHAIPKRFSSGAVVRVTLPATAGISEQSVQAANDLATQYTQIATAGPIVAQAASTLGSAGAGLTADVSAATVASQNLVKITARASSPTTAQDRANAMASAFTGYLNRENANNASRSAAASYAQLRHVQTRLQEIEVQIDQSLAVREGGRPLSTSKRAQLSLLQSESATLQSLQQSLLVAQVGGGTPTLSVFAPAGPGSQTQPRPTLYALVAFLVALLVAAQTAAFADARRGYRR